MGQISSVYFYAFFSLLFIISVFFGFKLGKRKTGEPVITVIVTALLSLVPMLGIVFIALLLLKSDIDVKSE